MQDQARRLQKEPREEDEKKIDNERHLLGVQLAKFLAARPYVAANGVIINIDSSENPPECFDDFDNDGTTPGDPSLVNDGNTAVSVSPGIGDISPEYSILPLPSRMQGGSASLAAVELRLRILQAQRQLAALREKIAEKSFMYSHVMRVAPQTSVRTRARSAIVKLDAQISSQSRAYMQCRKAMVHLDADENVLGKYRILSKSDLKSSTALLDPNRSGSSNVSLSWIWQMNDLDLKSPQALLECVCLFIKT